MNPSVRSFAFWALVIVVVALIWNFSTTYQAGDDAISFSEFMRQVETGQVENVTLTPRPPANHSVPSRRPSSKGWSTA